MFKVLNNFKKRRTNNNEIQLVEIDEHRQRKQTTPSPPRDKKKFSLRHIITPKRKRKPTTNETNENPFSTKNLPNMNSPGSCGAEPYTAKSQTLHFERKPLSPIRYNLFDNKQFMSPQSPAAKMLHQNYLRQFGPPCENAPLQMINNDISHVPIPSTPPPANRTVPVPNTAPTKHYKQQRRKVKGIQAMPVKPIIDKKFTLGKRKVYSSDEESRDDEESREDEDDDGFSDPDENDTFATIAPSSNFGELFLPSFIQPQKKTYSYCLRVYLIAGRSLLNTEVGFKDLSNPYLTLQVRITKALLTYFRSVIGVKRVQLQTPHYSQHIIRHSHFLLTAIVFLENNMKAIIKLIIKIKILMYVIIRNRSHTHRIQTSFCEFSIMIIFLITALWEEKLFL
jgi:hypothetical protein